MILAEGQKVKTNILTVIGKRPDGEVFRPSDWHLRLACLASTFDNSNRLKYNPLVTPTWVNCEDVPGLLVDRVLEEQDPLMYNFIRDFVLYNDLRVMYAEEADECRERNVGDSKDSSGVFYDY